MKQTYPERKEVSGTRRNLEKLQYPDRWSECPSTHCSRSQECRSAHECSASLDRLRAKHSSGNGQEVSGPWERVAYGRGGWKDGRLGQAYDLIWAVVKDRGGTPQRHPLLSEIESLDEQEDA